MSELSKIANELLSKSAKFVNEKTNLTLCYKDHILATPWSFSLTFNESESNFFRFPHL